MPRLGLDLTEQLAFYGAYHTNRWNQLIHFFFVPCLTWSALVWLSHLRLADGSSYDLPAALPFLPAAVTDHFSLTAGSLLWVAFTLFYIVLSPLAGLSWGCLIGLPLLLSAEAYSTVPGAAWHALGVHLLGWYMQIHPGHMLLERRRPALLDSFFQSLVMANLFVYMELLFFLGYQPSLYAKVQELVQQDVQAWEAEKKKKK